MSVVVVVITVVVVSVCISTFFVYLTVHCVCVFYHLDCTDDTGTSPTVALGNITAHEDWECFAIRIVSFGRV